jgi:hypothetical protein
MSVIVFVAVMTVISVVPVPVITMIIVAMSMARMIAVISFVRFWCHLAVPFGPLEFRGRAGTKVNLNPMTVNGTM